MLVITIINLFHITIKIVGNLLNNFWALGTRVNSLKDK